MDDLVFIQPIKCPVEGQPPLAGLKEKRFAVIIDEAHSSAVGKDMAAVTTSLGFGEQVEADVEDRGIVSEPGFLLAVALQRRNEVPGTWHLR